MKESADGKNIYLAVARSISLRTRIALYVIDKAKAKPLAPERDKKGKVRNRAELEQVLKKPPFVLVKDLAEIGNCGLEVKIRGLDLEDSVLVVRAASEDVSPRKKCEEFQFKFDLKSKKWIESGK